MTTEIGPLERLDELEYLRAEGDYRALAQIIGDEPCDDRPLNEHALRLRLLQAELSERNGNLKQMRTALEPYLESYEQAPLAVTERLLVMIARFRRRSGDLIEALRLAELAEGIAAARNNRNVQGEAAEFQGEIFRIRGELEESVKRFQRATDAYFDGYRLGVSTWRLGEMLTRLGRIREARVPLERAVEILSHRSDVFALASAREALARVASALGDDLFASYQLDLAAEVLQQTNDHRRFVIALCRRVEVLDRIKEHGEARSLLARAKEIVAENRISEPSLLYEVIARSEMQQGRSTGAVEAALKAVAVADESETPLEQAESKRTLGKLYLDLGEICGKSVIVLRSALDDSLEAGDKLVELEVKADLARALVTFEPVEAYRLASEVETSLESGVLAGVASCCNLVRRRLMEPSNTLFVISENSLPTIREARSRLMAWLIGRALHVADGKVREASKILGTTETTFRKLRERIREGLPPLNKDEERAIRKPEKRKRVGGRHS